MSIRIDGYWVKKSHLLPSIRLAKMYAWRHHTIFEVVERKSNEWIAEGKKSWQWEKEEFPKIVQIYQADPHFTEVQVFDWHTRYFLRWVDWMSGFQVNEMIEELMLPWKHEWYDGRVGEGTISNDRAWEMSDRMDEDLGNGLYFYIPIIKKLDPVRAILWDIWPPMIKDLQTVGTMMNDGMDSAPIPVFVDYRQKG